MPVDVELVHCEAGRCVVLVRLREGQGITAMALGEAASAEEAEDRARARLQAHQPAVVANPKPMSRREPRAETGAVTGAVARSTPQPTEQQLEAVAEQPLEAMPEPPQATLAEPQAEPPADPEDWSSELANLDLQLKRLGWSREQESVYLLRAFGHGSRSRLTTYGDLLAYLRALEEFGPESDPASCPIPLKRSALLNQCDQLLSQLGWDANRGRQLLESRFQRNSRQQLSDQQLLEFNILLEEELLVSPQN